MGGVRMIGAASVWAGLLLAAAALWATHPLLTLLPALLLAVFGLLYDDRD